MAKSSLLKIKIKGLTIVSSSFIMDKYIKIYVIIMEERYKITKHKSVKRLI